MNIPDHELVCRVGQGSYGEVWLVRNMMGSYRAAKFIFRKTFKESHPYQRELSGIHRFEPVSRSHPGFVHVLHLGRNEPEGYFYYVMEAADDVRSGPKIDPAKYTPKTLGTEISRNGRLEVDETILLAKQLTAALGHLHEKRLVHRDIKPSNIVFVGNIPKLADIGLVANIADARSYVGTEGFIPPEGPGSQRADIYSLGKVLYEAATGKDRQQFPELPEDFGSGQDATRFLELNEIILKACDPDAERRYQNAEEMLRELDLLGAGESVRRARKRTVFMKRARAVAFAAVIICAVGSAIYYPLRARRAEAVIRHREAVHAELIRADAAMRAGSYLDAIPFYFRALKMDANDPLRVETHRLRIGSTLAQAPRVVNMWFMQGAARRAEISRDGRNVLLVDDGVVIREIESGKPISAAFAPAGLRDASLSPAGDSILTASVNGDVIVWDVEGREVLRFAHEGEILSARFSNDGERIVTASANGIVLIWNARTRAVEHRLLGHSGRVNFACFSPDGALIVTAGSDRRALLWDAQTGKRLGAEMLHAGAVNHAAFSPDGKRLATASENGTARLWRTPGGEDTAGVMRHESGVRSVAFSPDGRFVLTASHDFKAHLWQAGLGIPAVEHPNLHSSGRLAWAAFDADGRRVVLASIDGAIRVWDLASRLPEPKLLVSPVKGTNSVDLENFPTAEFLARSLEVDLSLDGRRVSLGFGASTNPAIDLRRSAELNEMHVGVSGKRLAHASETSLEVYSIEKGAAPIRLETSGRVGSVAIDPWGRRAACAVGATLYRWNLSTDSRMTNLIEGEIQQLTYSADGRELLVCYEPAQPRVTTRGQGHVAAILDAESGRELRARLPHVHKLAGSQFNAERQRALTVGAADSFRIWDSQDGQPITPSVEFPPGLTAVRFLEDAKTVLGLEGNGDRGWLWELPIDAHTAEEIRVLCGLLSNDWIDAPVETERAWKRMRESDPAFFEVRIEQIFQWHRRQFENSRAEKNFRSGVFHLRRMQNLAPGNDWIERQIRELEELAGR